jgi:hypothetical protein
MWIKLWCREVVLFRIRDLTISESGQATEYPKTDVVFLKANSWIKVIDKVVPVL